MNKECCNEACVVRSHSRCVLSHIAIWTSDIDRSRDFYIKYFGGLSANDKYINSTKGFSSYMVMFDNSVALEIMHRMDITAPHIGTERIGLAHIAFSVGSERRVDEMTEQFRMDGYIINGEPRTTGDGFYEASVLDPDGNIVEIVA